MKLKDVSGILMIFGIAVILASFLEFYTLLYPVLIKNPEWIFIVSQSIAGLIFLPIFGIVAFLTGLNLSKLRRNSKIVSITKFICGFLCILFFLFIAIDMTLYGISMNSVKTKHIETLKSEIPVSNDDLIYRINYLNLTYTKANIKTLMTLFLFSLVYLTAASKICLKNEN